LHRKRAKKCGFIGGKSRKIGRNFRLRVLVLAAIFRNLREKKKFLKNEKKRVFLGDFWVFLASKWHPASIFALKTHEKRVLKRGK
jgi:hypothetical protein